MGKSANLSEEAYERLQENKQHPNESLSDVIVRVVPKPIETFGDLEEHLSSLPDYVLDQVDWEGLRRLKERKKKAHAH